MRKLLNTLYITNEMAYLGLDDENFICKVDGKIVFRIPFDNIESVICFSYLGVSPQLMGKCVEKSIPINFISPQGKFLAKVFGETKGNVFLRVAQVSKFKDYGLELAQNTIATKLNNTIQVIKRTLHDNPLLKSDENINKVLDTLKNGTYKALEVENFDELLGVEGLCAKEYFSIFNKLITSKSTKLRFELRTKRPPLDPVNAILSFIYTIYTSEFAAALETVGLDSYIGYYHTLRSGRNSLACDMVEECRCLVERFVLTLVNLNIVNEDDLETYISGAVYLNDKGRKKVITRWQDKKRSDFTHPYLKQKIPFGLLPYIQSNLLAKYVRGDIEEYPCFLLK